MRILAINPGSTSTKIAVYDDINPIMTKTLRHSVEELAPYPKILDQYEFRENIILQTLKEAGIEVTSLDAVVGRGGLLKPIPGGIYRVNEALIADLHKDWLGEHASNLGGILAHEIARVAGHSDEAFIVDPVVVDELQPFARYSGLPELPRVSIFHALNQKAVARRYAREINKKYEDLRLIVIHLGGGISVGAHIDGKVVDVNNALDGDGPFSPERSGGLPVHALVRLCYSGKYEYNEMKKFITGKGGIVAYLNTNSAAEVEDRAVAGDEKAREVYEAMAYQIAKETGAMATVCNGKVDTVLITGGIARSRILVDWITERVSFIAPVKVYPGEDEMEALSESVYYAKLGEIEIKEYV